MRLYGAALTASLSLVASLSVPVAAAEVASSAEEIRPILVGAPVPEVSVQSIDGQEVDLAAAVKAKPTLLIFYRGGW